jgi:heme A synthase
MMTRLARFSWGVVVYNLAVIAWGAYVRATGSGAGCGAHWPLCNGEVIPQAPTVAMAVEFSHRLTSGLALVAVAVLLGWAWRAVPAGHPARRGAAWSMVFMLAEAGVGAALVLFRLVADNASMARALFMSAHLVNTFLLLACLSLTAWWLSGGSRLRIRGRRNMALGFGAGALAMLIAGVSGAVAALGDTLFPFGSLAQALGADLSATSHVLVRLRLLHPAATILVAAALVLTGIRLGSRIPGPARRLSLAVAGAAGLQVLAGFTNVLLLAPVWMQMVHLVLADVLWIGYVLLAASSLRTKEEARPWSFSTSS